jgi:hypothetical protein
MNKCNHLAPKEHMNKKCDSSDPTSKTHYWLPTGRVEAMFNGMVSVDFRCKYCNKRVTSFLTNEEYNLNKKLLTEV